MNIFNLKKFSLITGSLFSSIITLAQIVSPNGDNIFYYNGAADVTFRYAGRGQGGRAFVHDNGNVLALNFAGDFTGGTRIGSEVYFKDGGNSFIYSGKFGLHTAIPRAILDVAGDISNGKLGTVFGRLPEGDGTGDGTYLGVRGYATQGSGSIKSFALEHSFHGVVNSSISFFRGDDTHGGFISFNTHSNSEKMRITGEGNVGIGTLNPIGRLSVVGGTQSSNFGSTAFNIEQQYADFGGNNLIGASTVFKTNNGTYSWATGAIAGVVGTPGNIAGYPGGLAFYTKAPDGNWGGIPTEQMRIDHTGNVGIGTKSPDSKLTVAGKIHSQEVKVTIAAGTGPDYVFAKQYQLKPLAEVENYIKENKHLPEIAPASKMESEGVDLGVMNMQLLKKIEELTLYVIEQNKKMEKMGLEIENLKGKKVKQQ